MNGDRYRIEAIESRGTTQNEHQISMNSWAPISLGTGCKGSNERNKVNLEYAVVFSLR